MKKRLINLIIVAVTLMLPAAAVASEFDWLRAISAIGKGAQAMTLTNDKLISMVKASVQQLDAKNNVAPASSPYTKRLNRLTANFKKVGSIPLNFKVYITKDVNAFACPDGSVRVYSGIMDLMTDDELLGIIGHEIGHVGMEHSKKALRQELINSAIIDAAGSMSTTVAMLSDSQLLSIGEALMSSRYSRKQETEADDYGYNFLKKAGKNPYNMVLAFEKMQKLDKNSSSSSYVGRYFSKMFSSHPQTSDRIKHLQEKCRKDGFKRPAGK